MKSTENEEYKGALPDQGHRQIHQQPEQTYPDHEEDPLLEPKHCESHWP